ncbi:uncharacterized protein ACMZJ9_009632 [Mantella aurantiaca]
MADSNDTQLLSDVYRLLEEKKSQLIQFLELQLTKPLNSSVPILNVNVNVADKYTEVFNVTTSLTYLLIKGNEAFTLNFTDPNGNTFTFEKNPYEFYIYYFYDINILSSNLVKSPAAGSWVLNAQGNSSLSVQILGFTGKLYHLRNCSDSDCHPNATCSEFGGYGECTCKVGFTGDGTSCNDIDECQEDFTNNCVFFESGSCVNTIGSYTCNCHTGFKYMAEFGCIDIDECADSSLNDCDPVAICENNYRSYSCTCPYGYYGDGKHCEINECQQGTPCNSNEGCIKHIGSYSCIDPCSSYTVLNDPWRSTSNTYNNSRNGNSNWFHCDSGLSGWYRFKGEYDQQIPERCVPEYSCGTNIPIWMNGSHPAVSDGVVNRKACSNWFSGCCTVSFNISVRMCPEGFYVYKLQGTPSCNFAYCTESDYSCSGVECAPDEECRMVDGVSGCHFKDSSYTTSGIKPENLTETNETITNNKSDFLQSITRIWDDSAYNNYYNHISACNQSLLYGLKRALEISPAESVIMVFTFGSMADYNDTQLLSDVYRLLKEKKSQPIQFLELQLTKPLNSSVPILNVNVNVTDKYTKVFNVTTSLTHLLITGNEKFTLNFTDPNGNSFTFEKNPYYFYYDYYNHNYYFHDFIILSTHLVKSPAAGSWVLNAQGNSSLSVQILGFTGKLSQWNCSDSDCHPNATCSEFGGYGECTCKEGFAGDGASCNDIDECQEDFTNNCRYHDSGSCVNTIGSYTCNCYTGFKYMAEFGCIDIDECADSSLNDCDPVAICANNIHGSYSCTCPYGYYGDGRHCEVNECQQGIQCNSNEGCIKHIGSYSCIDPCYNYTVLNDPWRSTSNTYDNSWNGNSSWFHCDSGLSGWYRFKGEYDEQIPERCVPEYSCGTDIPIWMNGSHPAVSDGVVNRKACSNWYSGCCTEPFNISVRMCPEGFYVYKLQGTPSCDFAYCTESDYSCSGVECAPDEECRMVDGVSGCHFKDSSYTTSGIQPGHLTETSASPTSETSVSLPYGFQGFSEFCFKFIKHKLSNEAEVASKVVEVEHVSHSQVSKMCEEIKTYIEGNSGEDPLVKGIPEDKNPFKEKGGCVIA